VLNYWTVIDWRVSEAVFVSGESCTIEYSNFVAGADDQAVFRVQNPAAPSIIANCYFGVGRQSALVAFDPDETVGVTFSRCQFSGALPLQLGEELLGGGADNVANYPFTIGIGHHAEKPPCEVPDESFEMPLLCVDGERLSRTGGPPVTVSGCSFSNLNGEALGGAIYLADLDSVSSLLVNLIFVDCHSTTSGGAVYLSRFGVTMERLCGSGCESPSGSFVYVVTQWNDVHLSQLTAPMAATEPI
jgi:hypothetical protein